MNATPSATTARRSTGTRAALLSGGLVVLMACSSGERPGPNAMTEEGSGGASLSSGAQTGSSGGTSSGGLSSGGTAPAASGGAPTDTGGSSAEHTGGASSSGGNSSDASGGQSTQHTGGTSSSGANAGSRSRRSSEGISLAAARAAASTPAATISPHPPATAAGSRCCGRGSRFRRGGRCAWGLQRGTSLHSAGFAGNTPAGHPGGRRAQLMTRKPLKKKGHCYAVD